MTRPSGYDRPSSGASSAQEQGSGGPNAAKPHYYRVFVGGYVFPELPVGSSQEAIREAVERMVVEEDHLDITQVIVESDFFDG